MTGGRVEPRWPAVLYDDPAAGATGPVELRTADGEQLVLDRQRWHHSPGPEEQALLERCDGRVLDVGCGPGRHALALVRAGRDALGVDVSADAVASARRRGAPAVRVSVWGPVPDAGTWGTVLLLDGNVGIGGNPSMLLARVRELLAPAGRVLVEVDRPGVAGSRLRVRVEHENGHSVWFPWARVSAAQIPGLAEVTGFGLHELWPAAGRWCAELRRGAGPPPLRHGGHLPAGRGRRRLHLVTGPTPGPALVSVAGRPGPASP